MRVMLDTNILISMIFFPSPITESFKHELIKHEIVLCDYVIKEIQHVIERNSMLRWQKLQETDEMPIRSLSPLSGYLLTPWQRRRLPERDIPDFSADCLIMR